MDCADAVWSVDWVRLAGYLPASPQLLGRCLPYVVCHLPTDFPRLNALANLLLSAASAIAANTFLRSIAGAVFPLFSMYMFNGIGVNWSGTLLGCVAALLVPIPIVFYKYGHKIRERSKFAPILPKPAATLESSSDD